MHISIIFSWSFKVISIVIISLLRLFGSFFLYFCIVLIKSELGSAFEYLILTIHLNYFTERSKEVRKEDCYFDKDSEHHVRHHFVCIINKQVALNDGNDKDTGKNGLAQEESEVAYLRHPFNIPVRILIAYSRNKHANQVQNRLDEAEGAHNLALYSQVFIVPNQ